MTLRVSSLSRSTAPQDRREDPVPPELDFPLKSPELGYQFIKLRRVDSARFESTAPYIPNQGPFDLDALFQANRVSDQRAATFLATHPESGVVVNGLRCMSEDMEANGRVFDKVEMRRRTQSFDQLRQPNFWDLRSLGLASNGREYAPGLDLSTITSDTLFAHFAGRSWAKMTIGVVERAEKPSVSILLVGKLGTVWGYASSEAVRLILSRAGFDRGVAGATLARGWDYVRQELSSVPLSVSVPTNRDVRPTVERLVGIDRSVYVKPAVGCQGEDIVRITKEADGTVHLDADSPGFSYSLWSFPNFDGLSIRTLRPTGSETFTRVSGKREDLSDLLAHRIERLSRPYAELEVPAIRAGGARFEHRFIFAVSDTGECFRFSDYVKSSHGEVTGNLAHRGTGKSAHRAFREYLCDRGHRLFLDVKARRLQTLMERTVTEFVAALADECPLGLARRNSVFAVDLLYVARSRRILGESPEPYLLEIQPSFGYEGLRRIDPAAAQRLDDYYADRSEPG